jgi:hypothetical protein
MEALNAHLEGILAIDWATIAVIASLCGIASYVVKEYLAIPPMIIFVFPVMVACGMEAYYWLLNAEQFSAKKIDQWLMWTILAGSTGVVVGIGCITVLAALRERLGVRREPPRISRAIR